MPAVSAYAPGKIILFGEHAVVYNRPAIAVPVFQVKARAEVTPSLKAVPGGIRIIAPQIDIDNDLTSLGDDHPLSITIEALRAHWGGVRLPAINLRITSTIPIAAGLGSSAAVTVAVIRAVSRFVKRELSEDEISQLAFKVEQHQHGNPSGIDNTVVTYQKPVVFQRGQPLKILTVPEPFTLIIGDTGVQSATSEAVAGVRTRWQEEPSRYEGLFDRIGEIGNHAREILLNGPVTELGPLMTKNHQLLKEIGVSSPELDRLVNAALSTGALGAKLSGGGCGGNMIALATADQAAAIEAALKHAGAVRTWMTTISETMRER